jgi:hypothetical protein
MDQRRSRQVVRGQQKKLKDARKWRYVEVECKRDDNEERSAWTTPCSRKWNSFLRQADLRRRKVHPPLLLLLFLLILILIL